MHNRLNAQAATGEIAAYTARLGVRKKWALIGIVAFTILTVLSFAFLLGTSWTLRDRAVTRLDALIVIIVFVFPYVGLVNQAMAYRGLNDMLALLQVLERAAKEGAPES